MANLTTVGLTAGAGSSGTGTVSTLDNVIGAAGTANANVQTVQGIASMTPLKVDGSGVTQPVSLATNTPVIAAGSNTIGNTNIQISGTAPDVGSGTGGSHTLRTIIDSSQFSPLGQTTMSASAPVVIASDQSPVATLAKPSATAGGQTSSRVNAAATTNATNLKASAGNILEIDVFNNAAYAVFLKIYNLATTPTVGTSTIAWTIPIAAGTGFSRSFPRGKPYATGIAYAITKLQADTDTTAVVAGDLTGSIDWI